MHIDLEQLIDDIGPCLSSEVVKALVGKGLSQEAARQRVSRAKGTIRKFSALPFPYKANFLYLQKQYNSERFWGALHKAIMQHSPSYGAALAALVQRGGIMPKSHFSIACGAPLRQKKHLSTDSIYERFLTSKVTTEVEINGIGTCVILSSLSRYDPNVAVLRARLVAENILLLALREWMRKLALASFDKIAIRDVPPGYSPTVGTFAWDLTGPSYLAPLVRWPVKGGKPQPGFIACDVLLSSNVSDHALAAFLAKCTTLRNLKNIGPCIQLFVADGFSSHAFKAARSAGIIPATPESLFGKDVAKGLTQLIDVLTHAAEKTLRPEVFDELFNRLSSIEGAAVNLRGALFEFVVADIIRHLEVGQISLNTIVRLPGTDEKVEVDIIRYQSGVEVSFIECKGYQPSSEVTDVDVEKWLKKRIPIIEEFASKHPEYRDIPHKFEFWTSGTFTPASVAALNQATARIKRYSISYKDAASLKEYVKKIKGTSLFKVLNEHYFNHPLSVVEKAADAKLQRDERAFQRSLKLISESAEPLSIEFTPDSSLLQGQDQNF